MSPAPPHVHRALKRSLLPLPSSTVPLCARNTQTHTHYLSLFLSVPLRDTLWRCKARGSPRQVNAPQQQQPAVPAGASSGGGVTAGSGGIGCCVKCCRIDHRPTFKTSIRTKHAQQQQLEKRQVSTCQCAQCAPQPRISTDTATTLGGEGRHAGRQGG